jgi:hypothetical protein
MSGSCSTNGREEECINDVRIARKKETTRKTKAEEGG